MSNNKNTSNNSKELLNEQFEYDEFGNPVESKKSDFAQLLEKYGDTIKTPKENEIISGKIVRIDKDVVLVDIGFKSEGRVPIGEFHSTDEIKIGDTIDVLLEEIEDQNGEVVLSKQKADFIKAWDKVRDAYNNSDTIKGKVIRRIKGGMIVSLFGVDAFLPGSQIDLKQVPDLDNLVNKTMDFRVIKLNKKRRNIVISRRIILEEQRSKQKTNLIDELIVGQIREGIVKNITNFGAFIDLGGLDGLLHITDISWGRINHPEEVLSLNQKIKVKILSFDKDKERVSLGLKQLSPSPWENIEERFPEGTIVRGKVANIKDYGAFIELEEGLEGLIHISEFSYTQHINHPADLMKIGQDIEAKVLKVDRENKRIALGLKQLGEDPWEMLEKENPAGSVVKGKVKNMTEFGAFVEIAEGIEGLVHVSDMSWSKRINEPNEFLRKDQEIDVKILEIDKEKKKVSLSIKQTQPNPWSEFESKYNIGYEVEGKVVRVIPDKGVIVYINDEVEGFVPFTHLTKKRQLKREDLIKPNDIIPLKVIEFSAQEQKIVLSRSEFLEGKSKEELEQIQSSKPELKLFLGDELGEE
ncbi:MAG: 30S ribosomal protein S1 [Candidatus Coatesbacteria bacterium]|nr:30S ribosomal protein S1 [Candidatus Coatesbacteria bacterium]